MVVNPHAFAGPSARLWSDAVPVLRRGATVEAELTTRGDGDDVERIGRLVATTRPDVVVAAGGDGTVSEVVAGMLAAGGAVPALAVMPLGTANNAARALGLASVRQGGREAMTRAVEAALRGPARRIDLGRVGARPFVGSFAVGMDADILALRNRIRRRLRLGRTLGGYPLYLWSCAANLALRHGGVAALEVDGVAGSARVYDLLVTNTPLYAGEFRFDGPNDADDGRLDLHVFTSAVDYVRAFVRAWRRHVHHARGEAVAPDPHVERVRSVRLALPASAPSQVDGEEQRAEAAYEVRVLPGALTVRAPVASAPRAARVA